MIEFTYINATTGATTTGGSIWLAPDNVRLLSFHNEWASNTGAFTFFGSNDPRARQGHPDYASADWDDITSQLTITDPSGGAGDDIVQVADVTFAYIRMTYTKNAGTGVLKSYFSGKA